MRCRDACGPDQLRRRSAVAGLHLRSRGRKAVVVAALAAALGGGIALAPDHAYGDTKPIEMGTASAGHEWVTVDLDQEFVNPVVIVGPPSMAGGQTAFARVRRVTPTSFEVRVQEWSKDDDRHSAEQIPYLVLEAGTYEVGGYRWHAGHIINARMTPVSVSTDRVGLTGNQVVLASVVSERDPSPAVPVVDLRAGGFDLRLAEESSADGRHGPEHVDYLAVEAGATPGTGDLRYSAGTAAVGVTGSVAVPAGFEEVLPFAQLFAGREAPAVSLRTTGVDRTAAQIRAQADIWLTSRRFGSQKMGFLLIDPTTDPRRVTTTTVLVETSTTGQPTTSLDDTTSTIEPTTTTVAPTTTTAEPTTTTMPPTTTTTVAPPPGDCTNPPVDYVLPLGTDVNAFAVAKPEGTSFRLAPGVWRNQIITGRTNQKFYGTLGADCGRSTVLNGSIALSGWNEAGNAWVVDNVRPNVPQRSDRPIECEPGYPRCGHPHDLFVNDRPLKHVASRDDVGPGTWFFDYANDRVFIGEDPGGRRTELSYYETAFQPKSRGLTIQGFVVEKYATQPQFAAIGRHSGSVNWRIIDNEVRLNHGAGIKIADGGIARGNWIHDNGQIGAKMAGSDAVLEGNIIANNNYAKVYRSFEAGGAKGGRGVNLRMIDNCVANNDGNGLWSDVQSRGSVFDGNVVFNNTYQGIFYEISTNGVIRNNVVGHNGQRWPWMWGGQITLGTSDHTEIYGNVVEVNATYGNGITVVWANRPGNNALGNDVYDNDVTYLGPKGVSGMRTDIAGGTDVYTSTRFHDNTYHASDTAAPHFHGPGTRERSLSAQQAAGQEQRSTIDSNVVRRTWSCDFLGEVRR